MSLLSRAPRVVAWHGRYMEPNKHILIVEDEQLISMSIKETLEKHGYGVVRIATSGRQAIETFKKSGADLILMDIRLEGDMDGITAVEEIHKIRYVPVIYLTAYHDTNTVYRANQTEHSGFMKKPVDEGDLAITVAAVLKKSKAGHNSHKGA